MNDEYKLSDNPLLEALTKAKIVYSMKSELNCPYFGQKIALNSEGFIHLQYKPNRHPRTIQEQILKLSLLKKALETIPKIGTLQEYRRRLEKIGSKDRNGFHKTKHVQYWGFHAILAGNQRKIKIILKQTGDGR